MSYDDEHIGRIVHDVADGWTMPPVRLDQPAWRERVRRGSPARRVTRNLSRPIASAAGLAVVLVVAAAIVAVLLNTRPAPGPAASGPNALTPASPTLTPDEPVVPVPAVPAGPTPRPGQTAAAPIQQPLTDGTLPTVTSALMEIDDGHFGLLDLTTGTVKPVFDEADYGSVAGRAADGSLFCLCIRHSGSAGAQPTNMDVFLQLASADGTLNEGQQVVNHVGAQDPRDSGTSPMQPGNLAESISVAPDSRHAYVGWSVRDHPSWQSGIDVVDVASRQVVGTLDLPAVSDGAGNTRRYTGAPRIVAAGDGKMVVARPYYTWTPADSSTPAMTSGVDVFTAQLNGLVPTSPQLVAAAQDCGDDVINAGIGADGSIWLACVHASNVEVRELDQAGAVVFTARATSGGEDLSASVVASADGSRLYVWDPVGNELTRIDTSTGVEDVISAPLPQAGAPDLLEQLGNWLAPAARAKMFLRSGVALSPDGRTLYALGVTLPDSTGNSSSTGLYVIDLGQKMEVARWAPKADLVSLAVSHDGRYVYAAGMPGVDMTGTYDMQQASVSVYDAATGDVTFSASQLGDSLLTFVDRLLN